MEEGEGISVAQVEVKEQEPNLVKIGWSKEDNRTEQEKKEGIPRFNNEGFLSVELDKKAFVDLLKEEGLTPQQINALQITFKAARLTDVDLGGAFVGGKTTGPEIELFTTLPLLVNKEETPPEIVKSRFSQYHVILPEEEILDSLLHELKHYVQYTRGIAIPHSWAVKSKEEHDNLPTEKEAIEFSSTKAKEFRGKFRVYDESEHFKAISEVVFDGSYVTAAKEIDLDNAMVARFIEDSVENSLAYDYFDTSEQMLRQERIGSDQLPQFVERGRRLVDNRAISAFELDVVLSKLAEKLSVAGDHLGAEVVKSGEIYGNV